jgi:sugar phosphate isomerase/epimerase
VVEVGKRLGADNVLVVSDEADAEKLAPALQKISEWADDRIQPVLEFLKLTPVNSLQQADELLHACSGHNFEILIDTLHLARSHEFATALIDERRFPYIQLCDGSLTCGTDRDSLFADALDLRSAPGEGELPLISLLQRLPIDTPLSLEVRSKAYRDRFPDPLERARAVLDTTRQFLDHL